MAQVQKTTHKALRLVIGELQKLYEDDGAPTDIEISTVRPRQVLVIRRLSEFSERGSTNPSTSWTDRLHEPASSWRTAEPYRLARAFSAAC